MILDFTVTAADSRVIDFTPPRIGLGYKRLSTAADRDDATSVAVLHAALGWLDQGSRRGRPDRCCSRRIT